jgi:prepilin-type N-terminal cleavage/methylation domain-containing protein
MMKRDMKFLSQRGFSLLEVVIAIAIFAIGMLALASLQGSLTRSSADANLRTTAANIAERTIEDLRAFGRIDVDPAGVIPAYADIANEAATTVTDGGIDFTRTITVTPYYYVLADDNFSTAAPAGVVVSDFKLVEVNVAWGAVTNFQLDKSQSLTSADIGTGDITLSAIVSSSTTQGSARSTTQEDDNAFDPLVNYTPGQNPDIVSLALGDTKFKESLTPEPEVFRENLETRFDVITYSQGNPALFLRREEFVAVSCECTLNAASDSELHRRPVIWAGDEYVEPAPVSKPYGEVIDNIRQSPLCDSCCQDHHDGAAVATDPPGDAGVIQLNPFRVAGEYGADGNHIHYTKISKGKEAGMLAVAGAGDSYVEACKLVRKDGFFRVAQDFRLEGLNTFPEDFLVTSGQVSDYSDYVTGEATTYVNTAITSGNGYQSSPPSITPPGRTPDPETSPAPGDLTLGYTYLPTPTGAEFQQLRSRSIYMDYLSNDLRAVISCINIATTPEAKLACKQGNVELDKTGSTSILEIVPFFEVQTTFLNEWDENPIDEYVEVTNEPVKTNNTHSRGRVRKVPDATAGSAMVSAKAQRAVLGLTATDPINNEIETMTGGIDVIFDTTNPPPVAGKVITGRIVSFVSGVQAAGVSVSANNASCNFTVPDFSCFIPDGASSPSMRLTGFQKKNTKVVVCSNSTTLPPVNGSDASGNPFATFSLTAAVENQDPAYVIWFDVDACTSG